MKSLVWLSALATHHTHISITISREPSNIWLLVHFVVNYETVLTFGMNVNRRTSVGASRMLRHWQMARTLGYWPSATRTTNMMVMFMKCRYMIAWRYFASFRTSTFIFFLLTSASITEITSRTYRGPKVRKRRTKLCAKLYVPQEYAR